jgi:anti-sigma regulatory factor (Ser/Thr protein kinase)
MGKHVSVGLHIAPDLPHSLESVGVAREWLDGVFAAERLDGDGCEVCHLLLDELVANAVIHGGSGAEVSVEVADIVRVEVTNGGTDGEIEAIPYPRGEPAAHFGLHLVHGLSTSWGVARDHVSTTVWFELPHPGRAPEPGTRPRVVGPMSSGTPSQPRPRGLLK